VHQLELVEYEYPRLVLDVTCSSGTYLRSLGRDIGEVLGTGAVMAALCRTRVGPFRLADAVELSVLSAEKIAQAAIAPIRAVEHLPRQVLTASQLDDVVHGRRIAAERWPRGTTVAAVDRSGQLVAIVESDDRQRLKPIRVFR
jgi:tRNA pseudouridine55 synthase